MHCALFKLVHLGNSRLWRTWCSFVPQKHIVQGGAKASPPDRRKSKRHAEYVSRRRSSWQNNGGILKSQTSWAENYTVQPSRCVFDFVFALGRSKPVACHGRFCATRTCDCRFGQGSWSLWFGLAHLFRDSKIGCYISWGFVAPRLVRASRFWSPEAMVANASGGLCSTEDVKNRVVGKSHRPIVSCLVSSWSAHQLAHRKPSYLMVRMPMNWHVQELR